MSRSSSSIPLVAAAWFDDTVRRMIHALKYRNRFGIAAELASLLADTWRMWEYNVDFALPVPLHPLREKERGYNQAYLLAFHFSKATGIPLEPNALRRVRFTRPQVGLGSDERQRNVFGAFRAEGGSLEGRSLLLIDDVTTSGATMAASAAALRVAGAARVIGLCLARPRPTGQLEHL